MGGWEGSESLVMDAVPIPMHMQPTHLDPRLGVMPQPHGVPRHHRRLVLLQARDRRLEMELHPRGAAAARARGAALLVHRELVEVGVELLVVLRHVRHMEPHAYAVCMPRMYAVHMPCTCRAHAVHMHMHMPCTCRAVRMPCTHACCILSS